MEILLLAITIVSLLAALIMGVAKWRVSRDERERSAARVAALAAAAADDRADAVPALVERPVERAAVVNEVRRAPWRPPQERRVELFSPEPRRVSEPQDRWDDTFLGSAVAKPASSGRQRGLGIAAGVLFVALVTFGYFAVFGGDATNGSTTVNNAPSSETPLELISLGHQRKNNALAITGLVRNPNQGQAVQQLAAVAFLFDQQGRLLTSARADVDFKQLAPGDESPFVITLDAPSTVARYRVSFRTDAGVVPHVDRRGQEPIARDMP